MGNHYDPRDEEDRCRACVDMAFGDHGVDAFRYAMLHAPKMPEHFNCRQVLEEMKTLHLRTEAQRIVDRLLAIHPGLAVRALDAVEAAVEVFEANRSKYPDMPGLKYPQSVHARHARDHLNRAMQIRGLSLDDGPGGDGLPDLAHALARLLMAGRAVRTKELPVGRPCSPNGRCCSERPVRRARPVGVGRAFGPADKPCGGLPAVYDAMTGEKFQPCSQADQCHGRMLSWRDILSARIIT